MKIQRYWVCLVEGEITATATGDMVMFRDHEADKADAVAEAVEEERRKCVTSRKHDIAMLEGSIAKSREAALGMEVRLKNEIVRLQSAVAEAVEKATAELMADDGPITAIIELSQLYAALDMIRGIARKYQHLTKQLDESGSEAIDRIADTANRLIAKVMKAADAARGETK